MANIFDKIIGDLLKAEGGYVNHKNDNGGATKFGITQATLADWRNVKSVTPDEVKALTEAEAKQIYEKVFYTDKNIDKIDNEGVQLMLFHQAVHSNGHYINHTIKAAREIADEKGIDYSRGGNRLDSSNIELINDLTEAGLADELIQGSIKRTKARLLEYAEEQKKKGNPQDDFVPGWMKRYDKLEVAAKERSGNNKYEGTSEGLFENIDVGMAGLTIAGLAGGGMVAKKLLSDGGDKKPKTPKPELSFVDTLLSAGGLLLLMSTIGLLGGDGKSGSSQGQLASVDDIKMPNLPNVPSANLDSPSRNA